jgi:hypothetical protein
MYAYFEKVSKKGGEIMSMPKDELQQELANAWGTYLAALGKSMALLEKNIDEAKGMAEICTEEWCVATEHLFDDLNNALFSISEPRWSSKEQSQHLKDLKRRIYDIYVNYRGVYSKASQTA